MLRAAYSWEYGTLVNLLSKGEQYRQGRAVPTCGLAWAVLGWLHLWDCRCSLHRRPKAQHCIANDVTHQAAAEAVPACFCSAAAAYMVFDNCAYVCAATNVRIRTCTCSSSNRLSP